MITPTASANSVQMSGIEESMDFCLDPAATAHILNMLRSGVYKDPKMACVREYWCNARDSVIEAGKDPSKHVTICLPNEYDPYLKIRDEGIGLSEADFRRIFRKYGASTKRDSNEQIGCLGIGSKSAFSYSDTYTVTAIKNGWKRVWIASVARNSVAKDGIGNLNRVLEIETEEPNGVEISIPVKEDDYDDFRSKVCHFLSFIPDNQRPIVRGVNQSLVTIPVRTGEYEGSNWKLTNTGHSYAIMGGVPYALDTRSMDLLTEQERELIDLGVDIVFPIGSFEFAISREEVRYTEFSQNAIKAELQKILQYLADEISKKFSAATNLWEAKLTFHQIFNNHRNIDAKLIKKCFTEGQKTYLTFKGKPVSDNVFNAVGGMRMFECGLGFQDILNKHSIQNHVVRSAAMATFVVHDAKRYGEWQRMSTLLKKVRDDRAAIAGATPIDKQPPQFGAVILLAFDSDANKDAFFATYDFDGIPVLKLSDYERDRTLSKAARQHARTFTFDYKPTLNKEDSWIADDCKLEDGGFYLEVKKGFHIDNPNRSSNFTPKKVSEMLEHLAKIGKPVDVLWGLRSSVVEKLDKTKWTNLATYFLKEVKDFLMADKLFIIDENTEAFDSVTRNSKFNVQYNADLYISNVIPSLKPDSLMKKYFDMYVEAKKKTEGDKPHEELYDFWQALGGQGWELKQIKHGADPIFADFEKLADEVVVKYPMIQFVRNLTNDNIPAVIEYIMTKDA